VGFRSHTFGGVEYAMKNRFQRVAACFRFLRQEIRLLHLPQHLGLTDDQGIQTRSHAEQVADSFILVVNVERVGEFIKADSVKRLGESAKPRHCILLLKRDQDKFHSIAGGNDHSLFDLRFGLESAEGLLDIPIVKDKTLA
jgi:hypothetical protein